jgi:hypothetical protein
MRLIAVAMVKNEADIIEAFVRHNLGFVDRLVIIDHASGDGTPAILQSLRDEGLPITVLTDPATRFDQAGRVGQTIRDGLQRYDADYAFALDADEFILATSRDALEAALAASSADVCALPWAIYVPPLSPAEDTNPLRRVTLRVDAPAVHAKAVVGRAFATQPDRYLSAGNHWVMTAGDLEIPPAPLAGCELAHLPFRSPEQLLAKVLIGWLGYRLAAGPDALHGRINWHWRELFDAYVAGRAFTPADLQHYAMRVYALPLGAAADAPLPALMDAPIACDFTLRYRDAARVEPARLLAQWAARLVGSIQPDSR